MVREQLAYGLAGEEFIREDDTKLPSRKEEYKRGKVRYYGLRNPPQKKAYVTSSMIFSQSQTTSSDVSITSQTRTSTLRQISMLRRL